jgi:hypothetical protein
MPRDAMRSPSSGTSAAPAPTRSEPAQGVWTQIYHHALATGFSRGYLVSAGIMMPIVIIALAVLRVSRQGLSGADPTPAPAGDAS